MNSSLIEVDYPEERIALVTLRRPERLNALTAELMGELEATLLQIDERGEARAVVLTGSGRAFCAGLDLDTGFDAAELKRYGPVAGGMRAQERVARALTTARRIRVPVIAAVNGAASGGGLALALAADVRLASRAARFNVAFVRIGLSGCDCGVSWLLPRAVGTSAAFELMLTGRLIDAEEAGRIGLVSRVVESEFLIETALESARAIVANAPFAIEMTKRVMWAATAIPSLEEAIGLENRTQTLASLTTDMREALDAFVKHRTPRFSGS